nr:hypothetical protein [Tanacetum cinerariifolium]
MPPYEMLYGRKCRTPVCWDEVGSRELASTDVVLATTKKIGIIRERLKEAQDRWKSYTNKRRRPIEFNVRDFVMLKVSPWKGVMRKCLTDESSMIALDEVDISPKLTFQEEPIAILGRKSRQLRNKEILLVKLEWKHQKGTSIRWEPKKKMRIRKPRRNQVLYSSRNLEAQVRSNASNVNDIIFIMLMKGSSGVEKGKEKE